MRKYLIFTLIVFLGCSTPKYKKFDYNTSANPWIDAYKDQVFIACLKESYSNEEIFKLIEKEDAYNPYDGLDLVSFNNAKQRGEKIALNIPLPVMCEGCEDGMNYYMATCLHYYKSEELDSIAKSEYRRFINQ
ncbi:hypothetical protein GCM10007424_10800 [Flavobacterium suaedae]|uniref:Lipoprotein n=1 Tax=Flavobacterium suaedae TaxID=1767027 RepID=A0ABQ1JMB2_9FLAO|nr:hypothetical protein [Flavobacterium suaedae]GGB72691.1 hypothetical protein GCM10007424_10800 [Flavobacterium suaedae]